MCEGIKLNVGEIGSETFIAFPNRWEINQHGWKPCVLHEAILMDGFWTGNTSYHLQLSDFSALNIIDLLSLRGEALLIEHFLWNSLDESMYFFVPMREAMKACAHATHAHKSIPR